MSKRKRLHPKTKADRMLERYEKALKKDVSIKTLNMLNDYINSLVDNPRTRQLANYVGKRRQLIKNEYTAPNEYIKEINKAEILRHYDEQRNIIRAAIIGKGKNFKPNINVTTSMTLTDALGNYQLSHPELANDTLNDLYSKYLNQEIELGLVPLKQGEQYGYGNEEQGVIVYLD